MNKLVKKKRNFRDVSDRILNGLTYLSSGLSILILVAIFIFVFKNGFSSLNLSLITGNYDASTYRGVLQANSNNQGEFQQPANLSEDSVFSSKWGIAFVDGENENKDKVVLVTYIDEASPLHSLVDLSSKQQGMIELNEGYQIDKLSYTKSDNTTSYVGNVKRSSASDFKEAIDGAKSIDEITYRSPGGGIRGSIIATLYLIIISLALALPLGIGSAIYLHEYAKKSKIASVIRNAIETLSGVPSIIFGLMGVSVLYPITQLAGATTANVLLGGLTLAIMLLPVIIRSCEEALIVIPQSLRDASLAVGANESQTIFKIVLPSALPGILTGVLLSIGRVIGESAALIYTMGTVVNDFPTLTSHGTSLAVHIFKIMSSETPNIELACAISIIILVFVLILNISVKLISKRFLTPKG